MLNMRMKSETQSKSSIHE